MATDEKKYCAIIYVGCTGSSWGYGPTPIKAAKKAAERCRKDWPGVKGQHVIAHTFVSPEEWYAESAGVFDAATRKLVPFDHSVNVIL